MSSTLLINMTATFLALGMLLRAYRIADLVFPAYRQFIAGDAVNHNNRCCSTSCMANSSGAVTRRLNRHDREVRSTIAATGILIFLLRQTSALPFFLNIIERSPRQAASFT